MTLPLVIESSSPPPHDRTSETVFGRRGAPRVAMAFPVALHVTGLAGPLEGRARDLSISGVGVETPTRFALAELRRVTLLPAGARIELAAAGRWQRELPAERSFLTGIQLLQVEGPALDQIWDLVHAQAKSLTHWLSKQPAFEGLDLNQCVDLAHLTRLRELPTGARVYRQGVSASGEDSLFVLMRGSVVLELRTPRQRTLVMGRVAPGQMFGGAALLTGEPAGESAIIERDATLLEISRATFENLAATNAELAFGIAAIAMRSHRAHAESALVRLVDEGR